MSAPAPQSQQPPVRRARSSGGGFKLLGALLGLVVAAIVALFIAQSWIESYLRSEAFRFKTEAAIGRALHAEAHLLPLDRKATTLSSEGLELKGSPEASFEKAQLDGVQAELNLEGLWQRTWQIEHLRLQRLVLNLAPEPKRTPASAAVPGPATPDAKEPAPENAHDNTAPTSSGPPQWLANLLPNKTRIASIQTDRATLTRGAAELRQTRLLAQPGDSGWDLTLNSGELRHPSLPAIDLTEARIALRPGSGVLRSSKVLVKSGGQASLTGEWNSGGDATFHAQIENVSCEPFLPPWWQTKLHGLVQGSLHYKQSAASEGVVSGELRLTNGKLEALPILSQLDTFIGTPRFRQVPLKAASAKFTQTASRTELRDIDLDADGILRVQGTLVVEKGQLSGRMELGISPSLIQWLPGARTKLFAVSRDGYVWTPFTLSGPVDQPVEDLSAKLTAGAVETVTETIKKLPATLPDAAKGVLDAVKSLLPRSP